MEAVTASTSLALLCPAYDPSLDVANQTRLVSEGAQHFGQPLYGCLVGTNGSRHHILSCFLAISPRSVCAHTRYLSPMHPRIHTHIHAHATHMPRAGCFCSASATAATFLCPAGQRCSRAAYSGLETDMLRAPTGQLLQAVCVPCMAGQYCGEGTYLAVRVCAGGGGGQRACGGWRSLCHLLGEGGGAGREWVRAGLRPGADGSAGSQETQAAGMRHAGPNPTPRSSLRLAYVASSCSCAAAAHHRMSQTSAAWTAPPATTAPAPASSANARPVPSARSAPHPPSPATTRSCSSRERRPIAEMWKYGPIED